jgi:transcriptional regulator with XRE-family HTH domain
LTVRVDAQRKEIGRRLKAYRLGSGLTAEEIARRLHISRAALYRLEAGEIVKLETLDALAQVLDTSLASLLGVGVEYYSKAGAYFERMRQLEGEAERIIAHFNPVSFLVTSADYLRHLRQMLVEALPPVEQADPAALAEIDTVMAILAERKTAPRQPKIISLISVPEIERFLELGLIGRFDLLPLEWRRRRAAARREVEHIIGMFASATSAVELGLIDETMPNVTFQLFQKRDEMVLALSPFRLGEQPNLRHGVATVTEAPEAVALYRRLAADLWRGALRGPRAVARLNEVVARSGGGDEALSARRLTLEAARPRKSRA